MYTLFDIQQNKTLIDFVKYFYDAPHRHFHNWDHIVMGFELAAELSMTTKDFRLDHDQQMAWLFHDIVYVPGLQSNEKNSVAMMNYTMSLPQFSDVPETLYAEHIIMSTCNHISTNPISAPVLDLDMSCFAFLDILRKANKDIMIEFNLTDAEKRIAFLEDLDSKVIYQTEWCKKHWEDVAHRNIRQVMLELEYV